MNKIFDINAKEFGDFIVLNVTDTPLIALKVIIETRYSLTIKNYVIQII